MSEVQSTTEKGQSEQLKSFDVLSSIRLYQHDLARYGCIQPETRNRVYDEELSYIAEGLDRQNSTEFNLRSENGQLVIFHEGRWSPYISTLLRGVEAAKQEAAQDFRKAFEVDRRIEDLQRGYQMTRLAPGEKLHWFYDFPYQQQVTHGPRFLEAMGYQPNRQLGYLCQAEKKPDGSVTIRQQSVDNTDSEAMGAALDKAQISGSIEEMRRAYDEVLEQKHGAKFYAGRRLDQKANLDNAWSLVTGNHDLIEGYFLPEIERLASLNLAYDQLEVAKKRLTYGVWARLKERIDQSRSPGYWLDDSPAYGGSISAEVESAYAAASSRGEVLFGCGGMLTGEKALLQASAKDVFESIFGKKMSCPFCGATQYGDPCSPNQFCPTCEARVENGEVKSKGKGRQLKKGFLAIFIDEFRQGMDQWNKQYEMKKAQKKAERQARLVSPA